MDSKIKKILRETKHALVDTVRDASEEIAEISDQGEDGFEAQCELLNLIEGVHAGQVCLIAITLMSSGNEAGSVREFVSACQDDFNDNVYRMVRGIAHKMGIDDPFDPNVELRNEIMSQLQ